MSEVDAEDVSGDDRNQTPTPSVSDPAFDDYLNSLDVRLTSSPVSSATVEVRGDTGDIDDSWNDSPTAFAPHDVVLAKTDECLNSLKLEQRDEIISPFSDAKTVYKPPPDAPVRLERAIWANSENDLTVTVTGELGRDSTGRRFVSIAESRAGVPFDEVFYIEISPPERDESPSELTYELDPIELAEAEAIRLEACGMLEACEA